MTDQPVTPADDKDIEVWEHSGELTLTEMNEMVAPALIARVRADAAELERLRAELAKAKDEQRVEWLRAFDADVELIKRRNELETMLERLIAQEQKTNDAEAARKADNSGESKIGA